MVVAASVVAVVVSAVVGGAAGPDDASSPALPVAEPSTRTTIPSGPATAPARTPASPPPSAAPDPAPGSAARGVLSALREDDDRAAVRYDRDLFGEPWYDVDRDGCDTRNDILGRDLADPVLRPGTGGCKVTGGQLLDPYDGTLVGFVSGPESSRLVQIDHVVALAWAWRHGAESWSDDQRLRFANDPLNLLAATEATNQAKSDSGPAEWLPADPARACAHVERFVAVLAAYDLGIDAAERDAADRALRACPA
ncbi:HNH endonuclease family protein [Clavibacter michiganensis]|uniref:HNH endonuclease family protein n=1 Tax=Clavibacter michiganensis TaxID=28447 RepID=UPI0015E1D6E1|nr:HNH endonuclease family protein [Clavibacter michiganensis]